MFTEMSKNRHGDNKNLLQSASVSITRSAQTADIWYRINLFNRIKEITISRK